MSRVWRQTISDELAALVDAQRGALTLQEYTTFVLASAAQQPSVADLQRQLAELRAELRAELQLARVAPAPPPVACASAEMLSF